MQRRKCKGECGKNRAERFFVSERGSVCIDCQKRKRRKTARTGHVKRTYGLTQEEYAALKERYGSGCWACGGTRSYELHVDHDHKVEKEEGTRASIRGLLDARCNKILRDVRDDPAILVLLANYLAWGPKVAQELLTQLSE